MPLPNRTNILDTLSSPTLSHKVVILGIPYIIAATWEVTPPEFLEGNAVCALGQMGLPVTSILYTSTTRGNGIEFHQMATKYYDRQDSGTNIISWDNKKTRVKKCVAIHSYSTLQSRATQVGYCTIFFGAPGIISRSIIGTHRKISKFFSVYQVCSKFIWILRLLWFSLLLSSNKSRTLYITKLFNICL